MAIIQAPPMSVTTLLMNSCSFASFIVTLLSFSVIRYSTQGSARLCHYLLVHRDLPPGVDPVRRPESCGKRGVAYLLGGVGATTLTPLAGAPRGDTPMPTLPQK